MSFITTRSPALYCVLLLTMDVSGNAILDHLVSVIQPDSEWSNRMINFLKDFPDVPNISVAQMRLDPLRF
ncbi:MAG: hypothetical protein Q8K86_04245 [Candidatus Nanopelagicaceae bacterium]|nr:hypothetical protein [Candidatus Nanopelagicaceae bacterium]